MGLASPHFLIFNSRNLHVRDTMTDQMLRISFYKGALEKHVLTMVSILRFLATPQVRGQNGSGTAGEPGCS